MKKFLTSKFVKSSRIGLVKTALLAGLAVLMVFASFGMAPVPVFAQTTNPTPAVPAPGAKANAGALRKAVLEKVFSRENTALGAQATNLNRIGKLATTAQDWITKAQAKGWDVSDLHAALNTFNGQIANARSLHETAAGLLSTHNGFDASGKVIEVAGATQTVRDARQALKDAHAVIRQAVTDLRGAIRLFRSEHKGGGQAAAPSTTGATH